MQWLPFGTAALGIIAFTPSIARFRRAPWWIILMGSMIGGYVGPVVFYFFAVPDWHGWGLILLLALAVGAVRDGLVVGALALLGRRLLRKTG